jgi:hypothetical protein
LTKFRENCGTFRKSFRFRERSKKCFRPNPRSVEPYSGPSQHVVNVYIFVDLSL